MNRMLAAWSLTVALSAGLVGCEKEPATPPAVPPAPKVVQGAALDGSGDAPEVAKPQPPAPAVEATKSDKPVTVAELQAATPTVADPAALPASGAEHESYQALLAQRQQTMDKPSKVIAGYEPVAFSDLTSFGYMPKAPTRSDALKTKLETEEPLEEDSQIPTNVKQLDNKKIAVQGYMIPVDFEQGGTNDFLLVQVVPSCYFCQQPQPNEWIEVKTKDGKRIPYNGDDAIILTGTLDVGAKYKGGYFLSLFRMEADGVHEP